MKNPGNNGVRRPLLSLSMIVKNEEKFLAGCLESVQGVVDEIVIADTGSTDGTAAIAERFGAKVVPFGWVNDFSAARNESLRHVTGEWVLYLDADERLAPGQAGQIRSLLNNKKAGGYAVTVGGEIRLKTGRFSHTNAYPRLFRNHPRIRFEGNVHEQIAPSIERLQMPILPSGIIVHHLGYDQSSEVTMAKSRRNIDLLRAQIKRNPDDAYARFQLGNSLAILKEFTEARAELEQALAGTLTDAIRANTCNLLAEIDVNEGKMKDAVEQYHRSIAFAPRQRMARWFLSGVLMNERRFGEARQPLHELVDMTGGRDRSHAADIAYDLTIDDAECHFRLGYCHEHLGDFRAAIGAYVRALHINPAYQDSLNQLGALVASAGNPGECVVALGEATQGGARHPGVIHLLAGQCRAAGDRVRGLDLLEECLQVEPGNPVFLETAIRWHAEDGNHATVDALLERAEACGCASFDILKTRLDRAMVRRDIGQAREVLGALMGTLSDKAPDVRKKFEILAARLKALDLRADNGHHTSPA